MFDLPRLGTAWGLTHSNLADRQDEERYVVRPETGKRLTLRSQENDRYGGVEVKARCVELEG